MKQAHEITDNILAKIGLIQIEIELFRLILRIYISTFYRQASSPNGWSTFSNRTILQIAEICFIIWKIGGYPLVFSMEIIWIPCDIHDSYRTSLTDSGFYQRRLLDRRRIFRRQFQSFGLSGFLRYIRFAASGLQQQACHIRFAAADLLRRDCNGRIVTEGLQQKTCSGRFAAADLQRKTCSGRFAVADLRQQRENIDYPYGIYRVFTWYFA